MLDRLIPSAGLLVALAGCTAGLSSLVPALPSNAPEFPGSPTTVYTRIARGANACWFGPSGIVDRRYIWHARAEPEALGGRAEILIHERFEANQRGLKAFSVVIGPRGEGASGVSATNLKMSEGLGKRMVDDVHFWARGGVGCTGATPDWSPVPEAAPGQRGGKTPATGRRA